MAEMRNRIGKLLNRLFALQDGLVIRMIPFAVFVFVMLVLRYGFHLDISHDSGRIIYIGVLCLFLGLYLWWRWKKEKQD
jgi:hypothetical protein